MTQPLPSECDVLVIGSGAAGLTAAVVAAELGQSVAVIEKAPVVGGTTAFSEGMIWVPGSRQAREAGVVDGREAALAYMRNVADKFFDRARAERMIDAGPEMLAFIERHSHARFDLALGSCDYFSETEGACHGGRAFDPSAFDGRRLGADFHRLRRPLPTTTIFGGPKVGGMMIPGEDFGHAFKVLRSARSTARMAWRYGRYLLDLLAGHGRGTRLGGGNALVASLMLTLKERGVAIHTATRATALSLEGGRVAGATVETAHGARAIRARRGVVLACGGFPSSDALKRAHYPHVRAGKNHQRLAPETNTGDGIGLAEGVGGRLDARLMQPAAWAPVSLVPQKDGTLVPFPHFIDRNKPGFLIVDRQGRRFVNEGDSYHMIVQAMFRVCADMPEIEAFVVADHRAIRRYSIGFVPPFPGRIGPHIRSGYLARGASLAELASRAGIDRDGLSAAVARFNDHARQGADPDFGRGTTAYSRANGDSRHRPNPALGPLTKPPFYAVRIEPAELGTFFGLVTNAHAQVLGADGTPISGLYAAGNDMASVMGGAYPGAGITIGAAMIFGFVAARHAAGADADPGGGTA